MSRDTYYRLIVRFNDGMDSVLLSSLLIQNNILFDVGKILIFFFLILFNTQTVKQFSYATKKDRFSYIFYYITFRKTISLNRATKNITVT